MQLRIGSVVITFLLFVLALSAQTANRGATSSNVPPLIPFSGIATDAGGNTLSGVVTITFSLYAGQQGGEPLWTETQNNVQLDATGHYSVELGITKPNGVPTTLFTTGEARWLGVEMAEQGEQPRVLLLSVPYALKAGDAATIGGLPPSAFVLAASASGSAQAAPLDAGVASQTSAAPTNGPVTGLGTVGYIPLWDATSDIVDSALFQSGSGSTVKIGINNATPATTLDVAGSSIVRGTFELPNTGTATAAAGKNSQPFAQVASAFNSTSGKAVTQTFEWQAEPAGNDTATASATLNLLFGSGTTKPAETGLNITSNGLITFATGQTFPGAGAGDGTVTSVGSGAGLTGGPITGSGTLAIDPTVVPLLAANNIFTGNQTVNANVTATNVTATLTVSGGVVNATTGFDLGGIPFAYGSGAHGNAFVGFAGNTTTTGQFNTASGSGALLSATSGGNNTAVGNATLGNDTTGDFNTAIGFQALQTNTTGNRNSALGTNAGLTADNSSVTGSYNTAVGLNAVFGTGTLSNATAIGANAEVAESNALVLGSINGVNSATSNTNVGIGTSTPAATLDVHGTGNFTGTVTFAAGQKFPGAGTVTSVASGTGLTGGPITGSGTLSLASNACASGSALIALPFTCAPFATLAANTFTSNETIDGNTNMIGDTRVDYSGLNTGTVSPAIRFGSGPSGEAISSDRAGTVNVKGIDLYTNNAPRVSITNGGSVGIGTTTPAYTLQVSSAGATAAQMAMVSSGTDAAFAVKNTASGGREYWIDSGSGSAGVGAGNFAIYDRTAGLTRLVVNSAGNVGIGTLSPGATLDVQGTGNFSTTGNGTGVAASSSYVGVSGFAGGMSATGTGISNDADANAGLWGDTGGASQSYFGVLGTADDNLAGLFLNNSGSDISSGGVALYAENESTTSGAIAFRAGGITDACVIDNNGNLWCGGTISGVATVDGGARKVAVYGVQSPENWFEDAGSGQLSNGSAQIALDPTFAQTVNAGTEYHVFLTPNGDSKGLYVSRKTATSFEVHEQGGGHSSIAFDYRIMAKRAGYENVRLADVSRQFDNQEVQHKQPSKPDALRQQRLNQMRPSAAPRPNVVIPGTQEQSGTYPAPVPTKPAAQAAITHASLKAPPAELR
jgi:hypothetical protein